MSMSFTHKYLQLLVVKYLTDSFYFHFSTDVLLFGSNKKREKKSKHKSHKSSNEMQNGPGLT